MNKQYQRVLVYYPTSLYCGLSVWALVTFIFTFYFAGVTRFGTLLAASVVSPTS